MWKAYFRTELPKLANSPRELAIVVIPVDVKASGDLLLVHWLDSNPYRELSRHVKDDLGLAILAAKTALGGGIAETHHAHWDSVVGIKTEVGHTVALVMTADCLLFGTERISALLLETGEWGVQPVK
jgi:hypothetical protein